jgi:predicted acylesterase/phospholipase RssA/CRP-like cAMP-binding protein
MNLEPLNNLIGNSKMLSHLLKNETDNLHQEFELVEYLAGEKVFTQGEIGNEIYFIISGSVTFFLENEPDIILDHLSKNQYFGEICLILNTPRTTTAKVVTSTRLLTLTRFGFMRLHKHTSVTHDFFQVIKKRLEHIQAKHVLSDYFQLDFTNLTSIQNQISYQYLSIGERLFQQGDVADAMYLIVSGRLLVSIEYEHDSKNIIQELELTQGQAVGEYAILTDKKRSATVSASRYSQLIKIDKQVFDQLLNTQPNIMLPIIKNIINSYTKPQALQKRKKMTIALIPMHDSIDMDQFAQQFTQQLTDIGRTLHLDSEKFEHFFGYDGIAQIPHEHPLKTIVLTWIQSQEQRHDYIVFQTLNNTSEWTRRCIYFANHIILVADAELESVSNAMDSFINLNKHNAQLDLALIHPPNTDYPQNTNRWLTPRKINKHYHLMLDDQRLFQRMIRRITHCATGLVLGGGGARGFAHVGAYRALSESDINIDFIAGSSMGALIGSLLVTDHDHEDIKAIVKEQNFPKGLMDYTFPSIALLKSQAITLWLQNTHKNIHIEDLWLPFFCISSNLSQATQVIHTQGPLWQAVRASMAIPALFPPVCHQGDILVDGGIMNNLPIDVMQKKCAYVIAIDVSPEKESEANYDFSPNISGWKILWSKINFFSKPIKAPTIPSIILRSIEINSTRKSKELKKLASYYIQMPIERFGILEFDATYDIIECGYQTCKKQVDAIEQDYQARMRTIKD